MENSKRSSRAEFWQNVLQQFTESKLSVVDFCSHKGLAVQSFYQCGIAVPVLCFLTTWFGRLKSLQEQVIVSRKRADWGCNMHQSPHGIS